MSPSNFENFKKQNNNEFNKQYAELIENTEMLNKPSETRVFDKQQVQTDSNTNCAPTTKQQVQTDTNINSAPTTRLISPLKEKPQISLREEKKEHAHKYFYGYCFTLLKFNKCHKQWCPFDHNVGIIYLLFHVLLLLV